MPGIVAGLVIVLVLSLFAGSANARDLVEYGRYLGVRLQMWEESYAVLDKIIDSGKPGEASRAKRSKAEVMKAEADAIYAEDGDDSGRTARYKKAVGIFGDPDDEGGVLAKAVMQLELAMSLRRTEPDMSRAFCDEASKACDEWRQKLEKQRDADGSKFTGPDGGVLPKGETYNALFYRFCSSFYVKALTFETGSGEREAQLRLSSKWLDEFSFLREGTTLEFVLSYELKGEIELARGNTAGAVSAFLELVSFLGGGNSYVGRIALEHGYLRAVELLTTELDYDPANLQKTIDLYGEAFAAYGSFKELDFQFKRFQLYRISALIKLGDEAKIKGAIDLLFKLATDKDASFRRQALGVLADIATRDKLDNELRFKCAGTVYAELDTNPVSVILKNIQAYQSLLMACGDIKTFETYAPACFVRIAEMYSGMWRFLDAALVYREACYRTVYFQEKFDADQAVPAHMQNRCNLIKDGKSLNGFPGEMASQFARHASYLVHKEYGEPNNRYFQKLSKDADDVKAALSGNAAKMELAYKTANELYGQKKYHQAAVRMVNLPSIFRSFHIALYIGAKAYYNVSQDATASRNNRRGEVDKDKYIRDIEDPEFYQEQIARHETDLAGLPSALTAGVAKPHWDAILDGSTPDQLVNWNKAVYYYKKYFLFEAQKAWDEIKEPIAAVENPTIADCIGAIAGVHNAKWARENPSGSGEPDPDMKRMGYAAYDLCYLLRNPPKSLPDDVQDALRAQERNLALAILRPYWKWFGTHLADSPDYKKYSLRLSFGALSEAKDEDAAEAVYQAYVESFPDDEKQIQYMVSNVYSILNEKLTPKISALALAASKLTSYANLMKKNSFERINPAAKDGDGNPIAGFKEDSERLDKAKGTHEKRMILAEHFWQRWMLDLFLDSPKNDDIRTYLPDLKDSVSQKWKALAEEYPKRWAKAVRGEYDTQIKKDAFKGIRDEVNKAVSGGTDYEIVDKIRTLMEAEQAKKESDGAKVSQYADLLSFIDVSTDALAYFTGTLFIYDFGNFLEAQAQDVLERARPATTRILKYYEEYRLRMGKGGPEGLEEKSVKLLGTQYFRIRDWENTVKYLSAYMDRFGGDKVWGKETEIPVDQRNKTIGKTGSGNEYELKYQLGKAYLELFKEGGDVENLKKAALLLRRCWCFNLVRDANEVGGKKYKWVTSNRSEDTDLQKAIEDYYLYTGRTMAEIFLLLHDAAGDVKMKWPAYVDQYTQTLEPKKDGDKVVLQSVAGDKAGFLFEASQIHLRIWASFKLLSEYQFRGDFRDNLEAWLKLTAKWLEVYGDKDMGVEALKGGGVLTYSQSAYDTASSESSLESTYLPEEMKNYLARVKGYAKQIADLCKKNNIKLVTGG
ncbi:MAG: hypothetical protein KDB90_07655 [Planctomycetes bacterium]|nr:hypothetical protein [Planctomycetota bacterium]